MKKYLMNLFSLIITAVIAAIDGGAMMAVGFEPNGKEKAGMHISDKVKTDAMERRDGDNSLGTQYKLDPMDKGVLMIKSYVSPVDTITRTGKIVPVNSVEFKYYSQDTRKIHAKTVGAVVKTENEGLPDTFAVRVDNVSVFDVTDQIMFPNVNGYTLKGETTTGGTSPLTMYVKSIDFETKTLTCIPINGTKKPDSPEHMTFNEALITADSDVIRLGHMADELALKTPSYSALPRKDFGYCQKFMSSTLQSGWSQQTPNEAGWTMADDDELAVENYKLDIEKTFIWGKLGKTFNVDAEHGGLPVYSCSGIIQQIVEKGGSVLTYNANTFDDGDAVELMEKIFVGNSGSNNRILLAGAGFITALSKLPSLQRQINATETDKVFGLTWRKWVSNHGTLNLIPLPIFNVVGEYDEKWSNSAIVIDPQHLDKRVYRAMSRQKLDLRSSGIMDADSNVLSEVSAICLKYAKCHALIMPE